MSAILDALAKIADIAVTIAVWYAGLLLGLALIALISLAVLFLKLIAMGVYRRPRS